MWSRMRLSRSRSSSLDMLLRFGNWSVIGKSVFIKTWFLEQWSDLRSVRFRSAHGDERLAFNNKPVSVFRHMVTIKIISYSRKFTKCIKSLSSFLMDNESESKVRAQRILKR